jgi:hypothetical protein
VVFLFEFKEFSFRHQISVSICFIAFSYFGDCLFMVD